MERISAYDLLLDRLRKQFENEGKGHEMTIDQADSQYTRPIDRIPDSEEIILFYPDGSPK